MLSRNLGQTLGDATSTTITAIGRITGFMSPEDSIDVNQLIGESFDNLMKTSLGDEVWAGTKKSWNKANRILSAASQIIWTIRSINDSRREIMEWIGENTGKIGNALKKYGVVQENAYPWMPERFNVRTKWEERIQRFRDGTENLDDAASSIESVASETLNITEELNELTQQKTKFEQLISNAETKVRTDNGPTKTLTDAAKDLSKGLETTPADLEPSNNATTQ
jgi:chromosome segregation ATPase